MFKPSKRTLISVLAVTAAVAPSSASATQIADLTNGPSGPPSVAVASHPVQATTPSSFDWGDAGIGAAAATVALMGAGGLVRGGRRGRGRAVRAS
jgi:hypothetical protein